ncbi:ABC transporter permease, partial [Lacticaseibacillus rhamnosus]
MSGDHPNQADDGVDSARQWIETEKMDVVAGTPNSGGAHAISNKDNEKNAILLP